MEMVRQILKGIVLCTLAIPFASCSTSRNMAASDSCPCEAGSQGVNVSQKEGIVSYNKELKTYVLASHVPNTIDSQEFYILSKAKDRKAVKAFEGKQVIFSDKAQKSSYIPKAQTGGAVYYCLILDKVEAK